MTLSTQREIETFASPLPSSAKSCNWRSRSEKLYSVFHFPCHLPSAVEILIRCLDIRCWFFLGIFTYFIIQTNKLHAMKSLKVFSLCTTDINARNPWKGTCYTNNVCLCGVKPYRWKLISSDGGLDSGGFGNQL